MKILGILFPSIISNRSGGKRFTVNCFGQFHTGPCFVPRDSKLYFRCRQFSTVFRRCWQFNVDSSKYSFVSGSKKSYQSSSMQTRYTKTYHVKQYAVPAMQFQYAISAMQFQLQYSICSSSYVISVCYFSYEVSINICSSLISQTASRQTFLIGSATPTVRFDTQKTRRRIQLGT